jgi:agmatine deiminase
MAWPRRADLWQQHLPGARADYARIAQTIARYESVSMFADPEDADHARARCGPAVKVVPVPLDDSWLRDTAPTVLADGQGRRAAAAFTFNAWGGKYHPYDKDASLGSRIGALADLRVFTSELVAEGGAFLSDGDGTLLTAETCLLNRNRNPTWSKAEVDAELRAMLGMKKIIWLPGDPCDTETDGHVDGFVAFIKPGHVLLERVADPADPRYRIMAENRRVLETETDARGRAFRLLPIDEAPRSVIPPGAEGYCRSYVNFYIANGAVICPAYGIEEDRRVFETLKSAYPDRAIVPVELKDLFRGGGGIHCITQQESAGTTP